MVSKPTIRHWSFCQISRKSSRIDVVVGGASTRSLVVKKQNASIMNATTERTAIPPWKPSGLLSPPIKLTSGIISRKHASRGRQHKTPGLQRDTLSRVIGDYTTQCAVRDIDDGIK